MDTNKTEGIDLPTEKTVTSYERRLGEAKSQERLDEAFAAFSGEEAPTLHQEPPFEFRAQAEDEPDEVYFSELYAALDAWQGRLVLNLMMGEPGERPADTPPRSYVFPTPAEDTSPRAVPRRPGEQKRAWLERAGIADEGSIEPVSNRASRRAGQQAFKRDVRGAYREWLRDPQDVVF